MRGSISAHGGDDTRRATALRGRVRVEGDGKSGAQPRSRARASEASQRANDDDGAALRNSAWGGPLSARGAATTAVVELAGRDGCIHSHEPHDCAAAGWRRQGGAGSSGLVRLGS
eukprot:scaffold447_cov384-Prasinococcus_capsulatus_cf.AAC.9